MNTKDLRIAIIGAGPSGGILGSYLAEKNPDIIVVDVWQSHIDAIKNHGLKLIGFKTITSNFKREHLLTSSKDLKQFNPNLIFLAVKTTFTKKVLQDLKDVIGPDTYLVSHQNGIGTEDDIAEVFGKNRALRGVLNYAGNLVTPGVIDMTFFNPPNYIGTLSPEADEMAKTVAELLTESGLTTKFTPEIQSKIWEKAILNSTLSGICAITQMTMKEAMSFQETYHMVSNVLIEAIHVATINGVNIDPEFHDKALAYLKKGGHHKPSMLIDIENHRQTEVEYLNGKVVDIAHKNNIKVPFNEAIVSFISGLDFVNKNIMGYIKKNVTDLGFKDRCVFCMHVKSCIDSFTFCPLTGDNIPLKALTQRGHAPVYNHIKLVETDRVATIKIDSPPSNQLSLECFQELLKAVNEIQWKKSADVLILTGSGKYFGSGLDLKSISPEIVSEVGLASRNAISAIETLDIPTISVINGFALGGGMELALATDIRIASDKAKFGQPEVKLGIIPGAGGTQRLTHLIGSARASEMILVGDIIDAQQALSWGIVSQVVPAEELNEAGIKLAKKIQKNAPLAIKKAKSSIKIASRVDTESGLDFETKSFNEVFNTEDRVEGIQAFLEKRPPNFQGK